MSLALTLLNTVILGSKATTIISSIGTNMIIGTINTTSSSIISLLRYVSSSSQPRNDIIKTIKELDLEFTINVIDQMTKEINVDNVNESLKLILYGIQTILDDINAELTIIKQLIESHNSKYFNYWRSFNADDNILNITRLDKILKHRYTLLFELIKINK